MERATQTLGWDPQAHFGVLGKVRQAVLGSHLCHWVWEKEMPPASLAKGERACQMALGFPVAPGGALLPEGGFTR